MDDPNGGANSTRGARLLRVALTVEHPRVVLGPTMERLPEATVRSACGLDGRPASPTFFEVTGVDPARVEGALSTDPTVADCRRVARSERGRTYRVRVTADAIAMSDPAAERGIEVRSASRTGTGWRLQLSAPDREALSDFREYCLTRAVDFSVDRLCEVEEWASRAPPLSERHRETLRVALEEGYFEIPRTGTQEDLAERLDVSGSAVSQRLRRATRELVTRSFQPVDDRGGEHPA